MFVLDFQALNLACSFFLRDDAHILTRPPSDEKMPPFLNFKHPNKQRF